MEGRALRVGRFAAIVTLSCVCVLALAAGVGAADFERSLPVARGASLDIRLYGGEVVVRAWDRDVVRLRATHFATDRIEVRSEEARLLVRARARAGKPHAIDLVIDVPSWLPLAVAGTYVDITVNGVRSSITAATVRGDIRVKGGSGSLTLKSLEGDVLLEDAEGRATLTAVNNEIRVNGLSGDLLAETVNGSVRLQGVRARSVSVGTVGGDIAWSGPLEDAARCEFATHAGDIDVTLDARPNATVAVRAFEGAFDSSYAAPRPPDAAQSKRFRFVLGSGAAQLELETFRGTISLRRPQ